MTSARGSKGTQAALREGKKQGMPATKGTKNSPQPSKRKSTSWQPNLFIVGPFKSGTTALYTYLRQHPDIYLADEKEPHHFCTDLQRQIPSGGRLEGKTPMVESVEEYRALFEGHQHESIVGEASPRYIYSEEAARNIKRFNPEAKIIVLVREPISFLMSVHGQFIRNVSEDLPSFQDAIEAQEDRATGKRIPPYCYHPQFLQYFDLVDLVPRIRYWEKVMGKKQVKVIVSSDLRAHPRKVLREVFEFLGVTDDVNIHTPPVNEHRKLRSVRLQRLLKQPSHPAKRVMRMILPEFLQKKLYHLLLDVNTEAATREPLDADFQARLKRLLRPRVAEMSEFLGRDLIREWGYDES